MHLARLLLQGDAGFRFKVSLTPKNIEDLLMSAALILFTSSILVVALSIAYRVAIRPLLGDIAKLRTGLEERLSEAERQIRRINASGGLELPVDMLPAPQHVARERY
jgi:hypothetical protein